MERGAESGEQGAREGSVSGLKCRPDNIFSLLDLFAFCFVLFFTFSVFQLFVFFHVSISFWLFSLARTILTFVALTSGFSGIDVWVYR